MERTARNPKARRLRYMPSLLMAHAVAE